MPPPTPSPPNPAKTPQTSVQPAIALASLPPSSLHSDPEASRPATPTGEESEAGVRPVQTWRNPAINKWRILCCCVIYFGNGLNDAVVGALIPSMEAHYHTTHTITSLIFVGNAAGFIAAAPLTTYLLSRLGRAGTLIAAEAFLLAAYAMMVCTPPFGVVVVAFFLIGYGAATSLALNNVFCANIEPASAILGSAHGSYGLGGTIAPILGTLLVSRGVVWSRFYFVLLGLRGLCVLFIWAAFWGFVEDGGGGGNAGAAKGGRGGELKRALRHRVTVVGALFVFAYQGAEVAVSGWIISFLISYRGGDPGKVGYVTAGFWAGITLGRFLLTHLAPILGEFTSVTLLTLGAVCLQLLTWLLPHTLGPSVAVSLLGLILGPIYPCAQTVFSRLVPRQLQTSAVGFIGSAGSSGGAVAPFTTGVLAQARGTWVIHPVALGLYAGMLGCWWALPRGVKRRE